MVEYEYSSNGRISVSARLPSTRNSARVEIKREYGQNLADLATWKARLLGLESSLTSEGIESFDSTDPAVIRKRIDALYTKIGKQAVKQDLPESLTASQQAVKDAAIETKVARDRLAEVENLVQHAAGRSESIQAKAQLAAAKSDVEQLQTRAEFSLLVLGRSCVDQGYEPTGCEADVNKVLDLKSRLPT